MPQTQGRVPRVSVLMPVRDGERHLAPALLAVLGQSLADLELIVVDDGSRDRTAEILAAERDPRLRVLRNERSQGLAGALNRALDAAAAPIIARQDADDLSRPQRLAVQVARLESDPTLVIVGSSCELIDDEGRRLGVQREPPSDLEIRWVGLLENPFVHSAVLLRRAALDGHGLRYDGAYPVNTDYDLWMRLLRHGCGANVEEPLVSYRVHAASLSHGQFAPAQAERTAVVAQREIEALGASVDPSDVRGLVELLMRGPMAEADLDRERARLAGRYLDLLETFRRRHAGDPSLRAVCRRAALSAAALALRRPRRPGWLGVLRRASLSDPLLPLSLLRAMPEAMARRAWRSQAAAVPRS